MATDLGIKIKETIAQYGVENLLNIIIDNNRNYYSIKNTNIEPDRLFIDYRGENVISIEDHSNDGLYDNPRKCRVTVTGFEHIQGFEFMYPVEDIENVIVKKITTGVGADFVEVVRNY